MCGFVDIGGSLSILEEVGEDGWEEGQGREGVDWDGGGQAL